MGNGKKVDAISYYMVGSLISHMYLPLVVDQIDQALMNIDGSVDVATRVS